MNSVNLQHAILAYCVDMTSQLVLVDDDDAYLKITACIKFRPSYFHAVRNTELIYAYLESEVQMGRGFNAIIAELSILTLDNDAKTVTIRDRSPVLELLSYIYIHSIQLVTCG